MPAFSDHPCPSYRLEKVFAATFERYRRLKQTGVQGRKTMDDTPRKKTILVIDDDSDILAVIIKHLKYLDYEVMGASDGMEGLKIIESGG